MHRGLSHECSLCLSVKLVNCDKTAASSAHIFLYLMKGRCSFLIGRVVDGGCPPLPEILGDFWCQTDTDIG